jgi:hypothetical protein
MSSTMFACAAAPAVAPVAPEPVAQVTLKSAEPEPAAEVGALPQPAEACDVAESPEDDRCPTEILQAAAMSYLGKTTAVFDGVTMQDVEVDPELLMDEASHDAGFCQLALQADSTPADGRLDRHEALALEEAVFAKLEVRSSEL